MANKPKYTHEEIFYYNLVTLGKTVSTFEFQSIGVSDPDGNTHRITRPANLGSKLRDKSLIVLTLMKYSESGKPYGSYYYAGPKEDFSKKELEALKKSRWMIWSTDQDTGEAA